MSENIGDSESNDMWKARELADDTQPPDISISRFLWLFKKSIPFMWPMKWHIIAANIVFPIAMLIVGTVAGLITGDLWFNKILNGQRVTDAQALFLFLDDSYLNDNTTALTALQNNRYPSEYSRFSFDIVGPALEDRDLGQTQTSTLERVEAALADQTRNSVQVEVFGPQASKSAKALELAGILNEVYKDLATTDVDWDGRISDPIAWPWSDPYPRITWLRSNFVVENGAALSELRRRLADVEDAFDTPVEIKIHEHTINRIEWLPSEEEIVVNKLKHVNLGEVVIELNGANVDQFRGFLNRSGNTLEGITLKGFEMTHDQRESVRNRSLVWFLFGAIFGVIFELLIMPYYQAWTWQNVIHSLRVRMIQQVEKVSLQFHNDARAGDAIYRVNQDSNQINSALQQVLIGPILTLSNLAVAIGFVIGFAPTMMGIIALAAIPMLALTVFYTPRLRRKSIANRVANSDLTSRLQETFAANKIIKANRAEQLVLRRFRTDSQRALDAALYYRLEMIILSMLCAFIGGLTIIGLEYTMVTWVLEEKETYLGAAFAWLIAFTFWNLGAFEAARGRVEQVVNTKRGIVRWWSMLQDLFIGLERAFYFIDLKPAVVNKTETSEYPTPIETVHWRNVHFGYDDGKPILQGVDLEARVGTMTAIVGQTGSGKSTMMSMLLRLYDPQEGRVEVNGVDLTDLKLDDVRSNCSIALQKNILFTGKVADNIAYATEGKSRTDIEEAARIACADEFIRDMDNGYDTELGDRGSKLSSGQRQRLTIARAVIRNTPILILDEPTASLDAKTEQQVLANLAEWGKDKVVFIITHRLSTIRGADQIAVLKDGQIAEIGTHKELIARNGEYHHFVAAETEGAENET